jgi:tetratricopeptide (TPR) repeat protein
MESRDLCDVLPLDGADGPALRLSAADADALVARIVGRAWPEPMVTARLRSRWLLVAAVLGLTGIAAGWVAVKHPSRPLAAAAPAAPAPPPITLAAPKRPAAPEVATAAPPSPSITAAPRTRPATPAQSAEAAADLLRDANQLRGQGRWQDAEQAYTRVLGAFPGTAQAYVATLSAASLRLEHLGDPAGALRLYQSVRSGGALAEEAELGVARCYRALGDPTSEAQALRRFLASRPGSLLREQAEQRLQQLTGATQ